jgi:hypothetical protein
VVVVRRRDLHPGEDYLRNPPFLAHLLRCWLADPFEQRSLAGVFESLYGYTPFAGPACIASAQDQQLLEQRIEDAFRRGHLVILREHRNGTPQGSSAADLQAADEAARSVLRKPPPKRPPKQEKTWIEFDLLDELDQPVPGRRYRLTLPDGSVREGTLDSSGSVRVRNIDPGMCRITFTDIDAREWKAA